MTNPEHIKFAQESLKKHGKISVAFLMAKLKISAEEAARVMQDIDDVKTILDETGTDLKKAADIISECLEINNIEMGVAIVSMLMLCRAQIKKLENSEFFFDWACDSLRGNITQERYSFNMSDAD